jgi:hypothetical protein
VSADLPDRAGSIADRDRWYPVAVYKGGEVIEDASESLFDPEPEEAGYLWTEMWRGLSILVLRRTGLPIQIDGNTGWWIVGEPTRDDIAFERAPRSYGGGGPIRGRSDARDAWLDAVAVAESRNQRAEEKR